MGGLFEKLFGPKSPEDEKNEKYIQKVMEKTGWSHRKASKQMKSAKQNVGISYQDYNRYNFYEISVEKQEEEYQKIKKKKEAKKRKQQRKENCIVFTMEKTGWSREEAEAHIEDTKKRLNISYKDYREFKLYNIPKEQQQEKYEKALKKRERNKKRRENAIAFTMEQTGWSRKETVARINDVKKRLKITYPEYKKLEWFNLDKVMERTGWERDEAEAKFMDASKRTGCTAKEYLMYKLYERTNEEQETFYLSEHQGVLHQKYAASKEFVQLIRNKEQTNHYFAEYIRRPWCVNTKVSLEEFRTIFKDSKRIIYKPVGGHCGYGIEAFEVNDDNMEDVYKHLLSLPEAVIEEYIVQHEKMKSLSPSSVNSLRFVTISSKSVPVGGEGKTLEVIYSIVRIGRGGSIVDNLHSGGMVANVNLETGVLETHGSDHENHVYITHPDTGTVIKGFEVPYFKEALEMVKEAIETKQVEGYIGWDIAISENGPMLLEINNRPGADGLQTPYAQDGIGMKHVMKKYM